MLADDKIDFLGGILCNVSCYYSYDGFIHTRRVIITSSGC